MKIRVINILVNEVTGDGFYNLDLIYGSYLIGHHIHDMLVTWSTASPVGTAVMIFPSSPYYGAHSGNILSAISSVSASQYGTLTDIAPILNRTDTLNILSTTEPLTYNTFKEIVCEL